MMSIELTHGYYSESLHEQLTTLEQSEECPEKTEEEGFSLDVYSSKNVENLEDLKVHIANYFNYLFIVKSAEISAVSPPPKRT